MTWLALRAFLGRIPRGVWIALACAVALAGGLWWHSHAVKKHDAVIIAAERNRVETIARKIIQRKNDENRSLSAQLRKQNDEANRHTVALADNIRLRGPGAARCPSVARLSSVSSGPQPASGTGDAAVDRLPDTGGTELIALPFADTIDFAKQADLNRNELMTCRAAWATFSDRWAKWNAEAEKARKP